MMIAKITNKDNNFYQYMGKFFGSRIVQTETKDRIYDDNNKLWYIYIDDSIDKSTAFISICNGVIKNIYSTNNDYLYELLSELKSDCIVQPSIVTNLYKDVYIKCGFIVSKLDNYKHFVMIRGEKVCALGKECDK